MNFMIRVPNGHIGCKGWMRYFLSDRLSVGVGTAMLWEIDCSQPLCFSKHVKEKASMGCCAAVKAKGVGAGR